jgi:RNA polymerase sigma-70 factor (ECF subfamily)
MLPSVAATSSPAGAPPTDGSLLRRFQRGSEDAATELYLRYASRLRQLAQARCPADLAQRVDADDIVQSVFSSFFRRARAGHYAVPDGEELWKLLLVIALNKIRTQGNFHRRACRDVRATLPVELLPEDLPDKQHDETALAQLKLVIAEALQGQPEVYQEVVRLRIEGHDVVEIARRVHRSRRTVERALVEFRELLHGALEGVF